MTRGRWIGLLVTAVVVALVAWIAQNTMWGTTEVPLPMRGEARTNPFYAAQRFSEALGARTAWQHALGETAPDAVVVISSLHWSLLPSRRAALERWVESGGRLVVDDQLLATDTFAAWSGITRVFPEPRDDAGAAEEEEESLQPPERCQAITEDGSATRYLVCQYGVTNWLTSKRKPLWSVRNAAGLQAVRVAMGRGSITAINAAPFTGTRLVEGDHGRLFVAATQLRRHDDVHFMSENERPSLLALVWRHGAPVVVLAAAWLAFSLWRGGIRLGPVAPLPEPARRSLAEQLRGTAHFALRMGSGDTLHGATVRALSDAARRRITGFQTLNDSERAAAIARLTTTDAAALGAAMTMTDYRRVNDLRSAIALLETARRQLLIRSTGRSHGTQ